MESATKILKLLLFIRKLCPRAKGLAERRAALLDGVELFTVLYPIGGESGYRKGDDGERVEHGADDGYVRRHPFRRGKVDGNEEYVRHDVHSRVDESDKGGDDERGYDEDDRRRRARW